VVADIDGAVAGFVVGYRPPASPDVVFVWQVAVDAARRGAGIASRLLDELVARTADDGVRYLEATVTPSNAPSTRLFTALAQRRDTDLHISPLFDASDFPGEGHEDEHLFRIGPL
jgi:L-2,4-diaminobutyric acid acetyltransferase